MFRSLLIVKRHLILFLEKGRSTCNSDQLMAIPDRAILEAPVLHAITNWQVLRMQ